MTRLSVLALSAAMAAPAAAGSLDFTYAFDGVPILTPANTLTDPVGVGVTFVNAAFLPELDEFGDAIPGTERWRPDPFAPDVVVDDPSRFGRGPAPSPTNALEALFQPVLVIFDVPINLDPSGLSLTLDNDTFGANGFLPAHSDIAVQVFTWGGARIGNLPVDQTTPGFQVTSGGFAGVGSILLPAGAFYDDLLLRGSIVPSPGTCVLALAGVLLTIRRRER